MPGNDTSKPGTESEPQFGNTGYKTDISGKSYDILGSEKIILTPNKGFREKVSFFSHAKPKIKICSSFSFG